MRKITADPGRALSSRPGSVIELVAVSAPAPPSFQAGLTSRAHGDSAAGASAAKFGRYSSAEGTVRKRVVHALYLGIIRLILPLHFGLPPVLRSDETGEGVPIGKACAGTGRDGRAVSGARWGG